MTITERVDAITGLSAPYRSETPPVPRSVKIELTARCDFKCFFCATSYRLRERADMDWDLFIRIVDELRAAGVEELGLFYLGESFLYPRLPEAVAYAKEVGFPYVFLTTNGRLATEPRVRACIEAGLDSLKFSFNFADGEQCRSITGIDAFEAIRVNIRAARRARDAVYAETGHRCGLYASSIRYSGEQLDRMKAAIEDIRDFVDEHYWLPLYSQAGLTGGVRDTQPVAGNVGRVGAEREPLPCWSLFTEGHVTFDGRLAACCFDHDGRFTMGDLTTTPFVEAWHSQPFRALRAANLARDVAGTACEACAAYQ